MGSHRLGASQCRRGACCGPMQRHFRAPKFLSCGKSHGRHGVCYCLPVRSLPVHVFVLLKGLIRDFRATTVSRLIVGSSFLVSLQHHLQTVDFVIENLSQGLAAGLQFLGFAAANEIVPKKNRGQVLAFMSLVSLPGSSFGSPIGTYGEIRAFGHPCVSTDTFLPSVFTYF
jgi:hypothetical protein